MHLYAVYENHNPVFYKCRQPICYVMTAGTHVLIYCRYGHLIRGRIFPDREKALKVEKRLRQWIDL